MYRRQTGWQLEQYTGHQTMAFPEFGLTIALDDLYSDILARLAEVRRKRKQGER